MSIKIETQAIDNQARFLRISLGKKEIETPIFFPSISSFGLKIPIKTLTKLIDNSSYPRVLVSCYDIDKSRKEKRHFSFLKKYVNKNMLFLDSGFYESYWFEDRDWNFEMYREILNKYDCDLYTGFDYKPDTNNREILYKNFNSLMMQSYEIKKDAAFIPIIHAMDSRSQLQLIEDVLVNHSDMCFSIAIPEKELGVELIDIIIKIRKIRKIINKYNENILLQILGCGDPLSILLYIYNGADIFDSRDWAKKVFHRNNLLSYPLNYLNTFNCECVICKDQKIQYLDKVLLHNLLFYENYINKIKNDIKNSSLKEFLIMHFDDEYIGYGD